MPTSKQKQGVALVAAVAGFITATLTGKIVKFLSSLLLTTALVAVLTLLVKSALGVAAALTLVELARTVTIFLIARFLTFRPIIVQLRKNRASARLSASGGKPPFAEFVGQFTK